MVRLKLPLKFNLSQMFAALSRLRSCDGVSRKAPISGIGILYYSEII